MSAFNRSLTANYVERVPTWHHLAVTWSAAGDGVTRIYKDGLLMSEVRGGREEPRRQRTGRSGARA